MSGWDFSTLGDIVLGLFIAAMGVLQIVDPAPDANRAATDQLRLGDSADLSAVRRPDWLTGAVYIAGGLMIILTRHPNTSRIQTLFMLGMGGMLLLFALLGLFGRKPYVRRGRWFNIAYYWLFGAGFLTAGLIGARQ